MIMFVLLCVLKFAVYCKFVCITKKFKQSIVSTQLFYNIIVNYHLHRSDLMKRQKGNKQF